MAYLPLSTANLPDPAIDPAQGSSPEDYFGTLLWSGDDNATRTIQAGGSGVTGDVNFTPDFSWVKSRNDGSNGSDHMLLDAVRGVGSFNALSSNGSQAEGFTEAGSSWINFGDIDAFTTDGFTVQKGSDPSHTLEGINQSGRTYVAWNWKANGSGVSNTVGSIPSTVSANTESGFSIVSYTGDGSSTASVGHGLDSAPKLVIVKARNGTTNWMTTFLDGSTYQYLYLNTTDGYAGGGGDDAYFPNNFASTTFDPNSNGSATANGSGSPYIAYCFHSVDGFSKFGSYTGNGSADGPFVYTGFRPAFVMIKRTTGDRWFMGDSTRSPTNTSDGIRLLDASGSDAEFANSPAEDYDMLSNGFKINTSDAGINNSGDSHIYMAFAENPFKYSNAR